MPKKEVTPRTLLASGIVIGVIFGAIFGSMALTFSGNMFVAIFVFIIILLLSVYLVFKKIPTTKSVPLDTKPDAI